MFLNLRLLFYRLLVLVTLWKHRVQIHHIYLLILLGGLAILLYPFAHWMHENEGTWNPWPRVETEKQKRKRLIKEQERQEKRNKKK